MAQGLDIGKNQLLCAVIATALSGSRLATGHALSIISYHSPPGRVYYGDSGKEGVMEPGDYLSAQIA